MTTDEENMLPQWILVCFCPAFQQLGYETDHSPLYTYLLAYLLTHSLTHSLTPWCRVLLELTGLQLVKKFTAFYGNLRFITALTGVRHLSLSCASPIQIKKRN